jgi:hypothetical protein
VGPETKRQEKMSGTRGMGQSEKPATPPISTDSRLDIWNAGGEKTKIGAAILFFKTVIVAGELTDPKKSVATTVIMYDLSIVAISGVPALRLIEEEGGKFRRTLLRPMSLVQFHLKLKLRGDTPEACSVSAEHGSIVVGPFTSTVGGMTVAGRSTDKVVAGMDAEIWLDDRIFPPKNISELFGRMVAPAPRFTVIFWLLAQTHKASDGFAASWGIEVTFKIALQFASVGSIPPKSVGTSNKTTIVVPKASNEAADIAGVFQ